ncbi:MAG: CubicO group peptidase (beta-lactamase class C family) [Phycisphaerales bacterium]|jgi:CubicO group peptidase (beta-lactamase class C family)
MRHGSVNLERWFLGCDRLARFGWAAWPAVALANGLGGPLMAAEPPDWPGLVSAALESAIWEKAVGGAAAVLVVDGEIVASHAAGLADPSTGRELRTATPIDIASCTKPFTAACLVLLQEQGRLDLDADLSEYLPDLRLPAPVPVRRLLTHTSGLQDYSELMILARGRAHLDVYSPDEIFELIERQTTLAFDPGERVLYLNTNYALAARVVEAVSGESITAFARANLFEPLGMTDTWYNNGTRDLSGAAVGHSRAGDRVPPSESPILGAGGALSTAQDLGRWLIEMQTHERFGDAFWREMTTVGVLNDGTELKEALGLMIGELDGEPWIEHAGRSDATLALTTTWPEVRVSYAVLTTSDRTSPYAIARGFSGSVVAERRAATVGHEPASDSDTTTQGDDSQTAASVRPVFEPLGRAMEPDELAEFCGYWAADLPVGIDVPPSGGVGVCEVRRSGQELVMDDPRGVQFGLVPQGGDVFRLTYSSIEHEILLEFERDNQGRVVSCWAWDETMPTERGVSSLRCPPQTRALLEPYAGAYKCADLIRDTPIRLELNDAGELEMVWAVEPRRIRAWVLADGRVTVYGPDMQCAWVPGLDDQGRVDSITYEGHRVWGLEFSRVD